MVGIFRIHTCYAKVKTKLRSASDANNTINILTCHACFRIISKHGRQPKPNHLGMNVCSRVIQCFTYHTECSTTRPWQIHLCRICCFHERNRSRAWVHAWQCWYESSHPPRIRFALHLAFPLSNNTWKNKLQTRYINAEWIKGRLQPSSWMSWIKVIASNES